MSILLSIPTRVTLTSIVNFSTALLALLMGVAVLWRGQKNAVNQLFFLVAFNTGFWTFSSTMADVMRDERLALFWAQMAIIGPFFLSAAFLTLSYYFPKRGGDIQPWKAALIFLPSIVALVLTPTRFNVESVTLRDWGTDFTPGPLYPILFLHLLLYFGLAARHLYLTRKKTDDAIVKKQIVFLYTGMILVIVSGVVTNLVLPLLFNYSQASVIGPAATLFFVVFTMYAIVRHGLLDLKVIATEVFAGTLAFLSFVEIFTADSSAQFAYRTGVFSVTLAVALLLIKSVLTEIRRREEMRDLTVQLALANEDLKQMDQLKSEFISIASHQLRTPITVIKGYLSLMLEGAYGAVDGALKEKAEQMYEMNERLVKMVNNMLNVTRIEKRKLEFTCAQHDVRGIVDEAVREMSLAAKQKGVTVAHVDPPKDPTYAYVDREKLLEALTNLIDNSIKYSKGGSVELRVKARPRTKDVHVSVADSGVGMTREDASHVFRKFFRAAGSKITGESGTGLGLYVVAMFIRSMGGDVWIERTAPGKGTMISMLLPTEPEQECKAPKKAAPAKQ